MSDKEIEIETKINNKSSNTCNKITPNMVAKTILKKFYIINKSKKKPAGSPVRPFSTTSSCVCSNEDASYACV